MRSDFYANMGTLLVLHVIHCMGPISLPQPASAILLCHNSAIHFGTSHFQDARALAYCLAAERSCSIGIALPVLRERDKPTKEDIKSTLWMFTKHLLKETHILEYELNLVSHIIYQTL